MKNNRRLTIDKSFVAKHQLSTDSPPENSLFWKMWNASTSIAEAALQTPFVQGIKNANLAPVAYGGFNVSDAYYCFNGAADYAVAAAKATDPTLQAFLNKKHSSYEHYNVTFPTIWHVKDADGIVPSATCRAYSGFETTTIATEEAIYALILMLPCEYLWAWLGSQLAPPAEGNLYAPWITGNNDSSGAYAMGNFIDVYQQWQPIDKQKAVKLYQQAMSFEHLNFAEALK